MKKKVLVYDVAAEYGGALSILRLFYEDALADATSDYIFVTSSVTLKEECNIRTIELPWVKKSWFHRLFCDWFYMPHLVKHYDIDQVTSLQNIGIRKCRAYQIVYVHNAIPFVNHKFNILSDRILWLYQNVISLIMKRSLRSVDEIWVQTEWMKSAISRKFSIEARKIFVQPVTVNISADKTRITADIATFFYPAQPIKFKNHQVIIDACRKIHAKNYEVIFTLDKSDDAAKEILSQIEHFVLPIRCVGYLNREEMYNYYRKSALLFPSYVETVGLPLLEAKEFNSKIIAADCDYARNALDGYKNVDFFEYSDSDTLSRLMDGIIRKFS